MKAELSSEARALLAALPDAPVTDTVPLAQVALARALCAQGLCILWQEADEVLAGVTDAGRAALDGPNVVRLPDRGPQPDPEQIEVAEAMWAALRA